MVHVAIDTVRQALIEAAKIRGLSEKDASFISEEYLDAELRDFKTHGIAKFLIINEAISARRGAPQIIKDFPAGALVDGQQELGPIAARYCTDILVPKVEKNGLGLIALRNVSRYSRPALYGEIIASSGLIGIVTNSAGPAAVAPYGGFAPLLGTNPLCIAFPCGNVEPIVIDFATSQVVWGEIRQAIVEGRDLPPETFYTSDGSYTTHPQAAQAVKAFGGAKGYALCLAIEILCGSFVGAKMGLSVENEYDLGFLFMAFSPSLFRNSNEEFYAEVNALAEEIRRSPALDENNSVRLPGDRSEAIKKSKKKTDSLDLEDQTWKILLQMSKDPTAGLAVNNLTN